MVVRVLGWLVTLMALAAPPAAACSSWPSGPPRSEEELMRDAGLVAYGEVVDIRTTKICGEATGTCIESPSSFMFRIDTPYKGSVLGTVIEVAPLAGCGGGDGGVVDGMPGPGARMLLRADIMPEGIVKELFGPASYIQTFDSFSLAAWEQYRVLWLDLEARAAAHPDDPARWQELARVMEAWRDYGHALKAYDRLAALSPEDLDVQASRGRMMFYLRMPEAEAVLSRVVNAHPSDVRSRSLLAVLKYRAGEAASLTGLDLSNADLRGLGFENVDFSGSDFSGADLRDASLDNVKLDETNLQGALFSHGQFDEHFEGISLRNANFAGHHIADRMSGIVGILSGATDLRGIKLSGADVPAWLLGGDGPTSFSHADLSGARIKCDAIPEAEWWQPKADWTADYAKYQREYWQSHINTLNAAMRTVREQPAALLDASCSEAIQNHLHENCAPWIPKADRSPACKIDF